MRNKIYTFIAVLALFIAGIYLIRNFYHEREAKTQQQADVLLEKIQTVCKLVTVEGHFTELIDYKNYWGYDFSPFQKKALVRVKAKVSVGYDLTKMKLTSNLLEKTVTLSNLPSKPSIISIDHDLDYYDITQGTFNSFTTEDYNKINDEAKNKIKDLAEKSDLFKAAENQGNQMLDIIQYMVESAGWKLVKVQDAPLPPKN